MAPPRKQVDEQMLETLASFGLTTAELAAVLKCSEDTLERHYKAVMDEGKQMCRASLRRKQFELAMKGNVTMLVWLGKNMLGQSDKLERFDRDVPFAEELDRQAIIDKIAQRPEEAKIDRDSERPVPPQSIQ